MGSTRDRRDVSRYGIAAIALVGCGRIDFTPLRQPDAVDRCADERIDLGPFGAPQLVAGINSASSDDDPTPSDDGLELYFTSSRAPNDGKNDLWLATRSSIDDPWGAPVRVIELSTPMDENTPELSHDALTMFLASDRTGTVGLDDLWVATRPTRSDPWSPAVEVAELSSTAYDRGPSLFDDDLQMIFHSNRNMPAANPAVWQLFQTQRADTDAAWDPPQLMADFDPGAYRAWMSPCGLELYYQINAASGNPKLFYARRATTSDAFVRVRELVELESSSYDQDLRLSPDRHHVYFASSRTGAGDIYEASR